MLSLRLLWYSSFFMFKFVGSSVVLGLLPLLPVPILVHSLAPFSSFLFYSQSCFLFFSFPPHVLLGLFLLLICYSCCFFFFFLDLPPAQYSVFLLLLLLLLYLASLSPPHISPCSSFNLHPFHL